MSSALDRREFLRKTAGAASVVALGDLAIAAPSIAAGRTADAGATTLRFATAGGPTSAEGAVLQQWANLCAKYSKGRLKIKTYVNGELGSQTQTFQSTQAGSLDGTVSASSYLTSIAPGLHVLDLPYLTDSAEEMASLLTLKAVKSATQQTQDHGIQTLALLPVGTRAAISASSSPPVRPSDFKGVKIRTLGDPLYVQQWQAIGAIPTPLDTSDVYLSLQRGLIGACDGLAQYAVAVKWNEVAKSFTLTGHTYAVDAIYVNRKKFLKLSSDLQNVVQRAANEAATFGYTFGKNAERAALIYMEMNGIAEAIYFDTAPFKEATAPLYKKFAPQIGPQVAMTVVTAAKGKKAAAQLLG